MLPTDFHHEMIRVGALNTHAVLEGLTSGPLVVMLHGFPEFWYSWRYQIKPLAQAGFRVVAVDMRGYNLTDKAGPYDVLTLVEDTAALIKALGHEKATIVGHDWGGMIAWSFAAIRSAMTERLIVCNLPHPKTIGRAFRSFYLPQLIKSWYIGFFQLPVLPEAVIRAGNYAIFAYILRRSASGHLTSADLDYYREAWSQPGAMTAMLGYYRALRTSNMLLESKDLNVHVPARLIWGEPDLALSTRLAEWSPRWCPGLDIKIIRKSSHFVMQQAPEQVTAYMLEFLKKE